MRFAPHDLRLSPLSGCPTESWIRLPLAHDRVLPVWRTLREFRGCAEIVFALTPTHQAACPEGTVLTPVSAQVSSAGIATAAPLPVDCGGDGRRGLPRWSPLAQPRDALVGRAVLRSFPGSIRRPRLPGEPRKATRRRIGDRVSNAGLERTPNLANETK